MHPLFADIAPPPHEQVLSSPVAWAVAAVALIACGVIAVVLIRRHNAVTRTTPPPGT